MSRQDDWVEPRLGKDHDPVISTLRPPLRVLATRPHKRCQLPFEPSPQARPEFGIIAVTRVTGSGSLLIVPGIGRPAFGFNKSTGALP
jgi:hypothetical protein